MDAGSAFESQVVRAGSPVNPVRGVVTQPRRELKLAAGIRHALTARQALRVEFRRDDQEEENLGVGTFDLPERAYSMRAHRSKVTVTNAGSFAGRFVNETRFAGEWRGVETVPRSGDATVRVLHSVTFGGANIHGGREEREFQLDQKLQGSSGPHTLSAGGRFEWLLASSDEIRNRYGTFTFSNQDALQAAKPDAFSRLEGNPLVEYKFFTGGVFLQDDIRVSDSFFFGLGLRQEWQSQVDESWNLAPRVGFSWAPTADGRTTVKGAVGVFNDWYDANTYENVLQLDGSHLREIAVQHPGYPDPFSGGDVVVLPDGRVTQARDLVMPSSRRLTLGVERRVADEIRLMRAIPFAKTSIDCADGT